MMQEMWTILRILNWTKAYFEDKGIESPRLDAELLLLRRSWDAAHRPVYPF